jgi:periplasmic divalent cation tolerance protein
MEIMDDSHIVVLITAPSMEVAKETSASLLESRLAACVNIVPQVLSIYKWEGEIHEDTEVLLIVKTRREVFADQLISAVKSTHPYDVPEIIALPIIAGAKDYLNWIDEVVPISLE